MKKKHIGFTEEEEKRYSRHLVMPEIGENGQKKLKSAKVLIVGVGALGTVSSLYLAAAGIGKIGIIDNDKVSLNNLQRQILYSTDDTGKLKVEAAKQKLISANPNVSITSYAQRLTGSNSCEIIKNYDLVVDGTDNIMARQIINEACVKLGKPFIYGGIVKFDSQISVFDAKKGPCYRCIYKNLSCSAKTDSCAKSGVLNVLSGITGTIQANEAIKLILGKGRTLIGKLLAFNALQMEFNELNIKKNSNCHVCGKKA